MAFILAKGPYVMEHLQKRSGVLPVSLSVVHEVTCFAVLPIGVVSGLYLIPE